MKIINVELNESKVRKHYEDTKDPAISKLRNDLKNIVIEYTVSEVKRIMDDYPGEDIKINFYKS